MLVSRGGLREGPTFSVRGNGVCRNNMTLENAQEFLERWDTDHPPTPAPAPPRGDRKPVLKPKCSDEPSEEIRIAVDRYIAETRGEAVR